MDVLPADHGPAPPFAIDAAAAIGAKPTATDPLPGATLDPAELLDVDVHELARPRPLVTDGGPGPRPSEPAGAVAAKHDRDGRERHRQPLGDLSRGHSQSPQRHDRRDPISRGAVRDPARS